MKIHLLVIGRNLHKQKEQDFRNAEAEYLKRLKAFCDFKVTECKDEKSLINAIPKDAMVVGFDERGANVSSKEFAQETLRRAQEQAKQLVFAIGDPDGHSDELRSSFDQTLAFGKMTVPHRLARVLAIEQVYRAFTILSGHPYHR